MFMSIASVALALQVSTPVPFPNESETLVQEVQYRVPVHPPPCGHGWDLSARDGLCYPNPLTWGHYQTKWRRWPTDYLEPLPDEARPPAPLPADIRPYEAPTAEEEDRRAPPPTAPRVQPGRDEDGAPVPPATAPGTAAPPTMPITPPQPPTTFPWDDNATDDEPPRSRLPLEGEPPPTTLPFGGEPPTTLPFNEPMGESDPAPAPPFASSLKGRAPATRAAIAPAPQPTRERTGESRPDDPPPALPVAMVSWTN